MVKRALTLLTSILIALPLLMPFNIYAQDTAVVVGTDVSLISTNLLKSEQWSVASGTMTGYFNQFIYHVTVQLDNNYVGYIKFSLNVSYMNRPESGLRQDSETITRKVFINGDKAEFNFDIVSWYADEPLLRNTTNGTPNAVIQEQGVTLLSELDSIQQIIDILNDLYNSQDQLEGLLNNQLAQLQLVVSNTSLANQYLDTISKFRQWNVYMESVPVVYDYLSKNYEYTMFNNSIANYPLFKLNAGDSLFNIDTPQSMVFIFYSNALISSVSNITYRFNLNNINVYSVTIINEVSINDNVYRLYKVIFGRKTNGSLIMSTIYNTNVIPIYLNWYNNKNISTDFALQYGLSNNLLDNIDKIANGTVQSNSAAQSSDSANSQLQTDSNTLFQQENGFKSDMQNAMQNVNNTFRLQDMGAKFVSSAQWVRSQYENLTNNTPFASLITFSLITGLALILLGKVYK